MSLPFDYSEVSRRLIAWYGKQGRDLPWRHTRDPYRIWVSEIMLQQTTVTAVIPYYERFLKQFPTVVQLASASLDEVINLWAGLGYYSRARNLHKAAQHVKAGYAGVFPDSLEGLMALPGIGRSTAGAILSIAYGQSAPILDGNVRRVLVRLFAWDEDPRSSKAEKQLWAWSEQLTPETSVHDYTQAIMDLGATVCTPRNPACTDCPIKTLCQAYAKGLAEALPVARKKAVLPVRRQVAVIVVDKKNSLLLQKRPAEGFLGGLWEFPTVDLTDSVDAEQTANSLIAELGFKGEARKVGDVRHAYSHFKLELQVFKVDVEESFVIAESCRQVQWVPLDDSKRIALHGAHKKALAALNLACVDKSL